MSAFKAANDMCASIRDEDGQVKAAAFLKTCELAIPIVDKFGSGFMLVRNDIQGNIDRLSKRRLEDPVKFTILVDIAKDEQQAGQQASSTSCCKGLLWLTRAMTFIHELVKQLVDNPSIEVYAAATAAYALILEPYHGFFARSAFAIAMNFVPTRQSFMNALGNSETIQEDMQMFVDNFGSILKQLYDWLDANGLNDPSRV